MQWQPVCRTTTIKRPKSRDCVAVDREFIFLKVQYEAVDSTVIDGFIAVSEGER